MAKKETNGKNKIKQERRARNVIELSARKARKFFLKSESFCSMDLPPYFVFDKLLGSIYKKIRDKNPNNFYDQNKLKSRSSDELNHTIFNNRDGKYAWRPLQLINPFLYVSLVHEITEKDRWQFIKKRFQTFSRNEKIKCVSHPVESLTGQKDKAEQVSSWWEKLEQRSVSLALDYEYLIRTDISDCYGSVYTHSIAWALHGKKTAKKERLDKSLIGNIIDKRIQDIRGGQTNGIPQGSVLMDFIAEIVLGYVDLKLSKRIKKQKIEDYKILRYRDDYRIFTNNPRDGEEILKLLTEELIDLGLKLNPAKTLLTDEVIRESIKPDKLFWIGQRRKEKNFQKQLLIIHDLAMQFPNSGSLVATLNDYYETIPPSEKFSTIRNEKVTKKIKGSSSQLISIITDIVYHNPKVYQISSAILSKFICLINEDGEKAEMISKIERRLGQIPNIGYLQIWLQRITVKFDRGRLYKEELSKLVQGNSDNSIIWDFSWIDGQFGKQIEKIEIIDEEKMKNLPPFVSKEEVELFRSDY